MRGSHSTRCRLLMAGHPTRHPRLLRQCSLCRKRWRCRKTSCLTRDHPGARLIYVEGPLAIPSARQREHQLKRWSRTKKLALIQNEIELLRRRVIPRLP
jgi:hypothetical protein